MGETQSEIERLRAAIRADAGLRTGLQSCDDPKDFAAAALSGAAARGIVVDPESLNKSLSDDPIGLSRYAFTPVTRECPQDAWLPVHLSVSPGEAFIDWAYFGERGLTEPFFEDSIRLALRHPINRFVRYRTPLADLARCVGQRTTLPPSGFIFHMSRCGSTLVSRMLATDARNLVISEASPVDEAVKARSVPAGADAEPSALLWSMVAALGAKRAAAQSRYFIKLDSWHVLSLPLFRKAFPSAPWLFLYREPSEVLASQLLQRGIQTVPEYLPPSVFGLTDADTLPPADYCARVLGRICEAALRSCQEDGGLLVNYNQLPEALWSEILPHFGVDCSERDREGMARIAHFDAKTPGMPFSAEEDRRHKRAGDALRVIAERHIGPAYRALEEFRVRQKPPNAASP